MTVSSAMILQLSSQVRMSTGCSTIRAADACCPLQQVKKVFHGRGVPGVAGSAVVERHRGSQDLLDPLFASFSQLSSLPTLRDLTGRRPCRIAEELPRSHRPLRLERRLHIHGGLSPMPQLAQHRRCRSATHSMITPFTRPVQQRRDALAPGPSYTGHRSAAYHALLDSITAGNDRERVHAASSRAAMSTVSSSTRVSRWARPQDDGGETERVVSCVRFLSVASPCTLPLTLHYTAPNQTAERQARLDLHFFGPWAAWRSCTRHPPREGRGTTHAAARGRRR